MVGQAATFDTPISSADSRSSPSGHLPTRRTPAARAVLVLTASSIAAGLATVFRANRTARMGVTHDAAADRRNRITASDGFRRAASILAASVLGDSAMEHFRGEYLNRAMFLAPTAAAAAMVAARELRPARVSSTSTPERRRAGILPSDVVFASATVAGVTGLAFHAYNTLKRPGGISWNNLFYAAPIGAPGALLVAGLFGLMAPRAAMVEHANPRLRRQAGRLAAAFTGACVLATTGEIWLLHFRGAFHNPAMLAPVTIAPAAGLALISTATHPSPARLRIARALTCATALLGPIGTAFHAYGVGRNMGGWANWRQNLLAGPPMPAPISLSGLALAGLGALHLLRRAEQSR